MQGKGKGRSRMHPPAGPLRTKNGVLLIVGWAFLWFALEKVFFGEAVYRYSTEQLRVFFHHTVTLVALCLCSCFLAFCSPS